MTGRLHQPSGNVGRTVHFADGTSAVVYRDTVCDGPGPSAPAVLVVCFSLRGVRRGWAHAAFRLESELNTVLFAGFPGMVSKLWLRHDDQGRYRGLYQWDTAALAVDYVRALWWALAVVSQPATIHYAVLPGMRRDELLADPSAVDAHVDAGADGWWRPVLAAPAAGAVTRPTGGPRRPAASPSRGRRAGRHGPSRGGAAR